jgi:ABC-2 type transport system ATP-binding protein
VLVQPADASALVTALQEGGFTQVSPTPDGRVAVVGATVQQIGDLAAKAGLAVYGMQEEHADLERLFFQLTSPQYSAVPPQPHQWQGPPPGYQQYQQPGFQQIQQPYQQQYQQPYQAPPGHQQAPPQGPSQGQNEGWGGQR